MKRILLISLVLFSIHSFSQDSLENDTILLVEQIEKPETNEAALPEKDIVINNNIPASGTDFITPLVSIFSLLIGFGLNKWYDNYSVQKKIKSGGNLWTENLIQLRKPLEGQIKTIEEYIPLNDENTFEIQDMQYSVSLDCDEFKALDEGALVPFLMQAKKGTNHKAAIILAGQIKSTIKIIETNSLGYKEVYHTLRNSTAPFMSEFQQNFNDFRLAAGKYLDFAFHNYTAGTAQHIAATNIKNLFHTEIDPHLKTGAFDLFELETTFLAPYFLESHVDRAHPLMNESINHLHHCSRNIKAIRMERTYFRIKLEKRLKSYKTQLERLDEIFEDPTFPIQ